MSFTDTREMRQERARLLETARERIDKADRAKRLLTATEEVQQRRDLAEAERLHRKIEDTEAMNDVERGVALRESQAKHGFASDGNSLRFRNVETGQEIRAVRRGESFRSACGVQAPDMSVGRLVVGAATGNWRGGENEQRAYSQSVSASGGYLLNAEMSAHVIDLARARSVVSEAGCLTLPMHSEELKIARVASDAVAYWTHENQEITESSGTFDLITLRAKCLAVYCTASLELIRNAANAEAIIEQTVAKAIATKLDESALNGEGADQEPMGLLYNPDVGTYSIGGALTYDKMLRGCRRLWDVNVEAKSLLMDSNVRATMAMLKDGEGQYQVSPPELAKVTPYMSTQISSTDSNKCCYIGDFSNCIFGVRNSIEIEVSGVAGDLFKRKQVGIRALLWGDFYACRSGDILRLTAITAST